MAVLNLCAKLLSGQDSSCAPPVRKYYQQVVLINKDDIDYENSVVTKPDLEADPPVCNYKVQMVLKEGTLGFRFSGPENGSSFFGTFDKSRSDLGFTQYIHHANIIVTGADEEAKCRLDSLDKGKFVAAYQLLDGTVEIYGWANGIGTDDYTHDLQGGGGATPLVLSSNEDAPENEVPFVYVSAVPGDETVDFDAAFENPVV